MTPTVVQWLTLITTALALVTALVSLVNSIMNRFSLRKIHVDINSRITELLLEKGKASFNAGRREGVESQSKQ